MQSYESYLNRIFALPFEDAAHIFARIKTDIENEETALELYHYLLTYAIAYALVRS